MTRVIFLRHGESYDDIFKEFGGWSDREPTKKGLLLAAQTASDLKKLYPDIKKIYTSPLKRAQLFAKVVAKKFKLPAEELVYLKERNTYGLLNGLTHKLAKKIYPELVAKFERQEFIPGSERYEDFVERINYLLDFISEIETDGIILCVTQGYLVTTLIEEKLNLLRDKIGHGSYIVCDIGKRKVKLIDYHGITFLNGPKEEKERKGKLKKFKTKTRAR